MRLPDSAHSSQPWRIHELTPDFRLEDVWALPTPGGPDDFPSLLELLGWDEPDADKRARGPNLRDRLPDDLRAGPSGRARAICPSLYLTGDEWAAEIVDRTVHGVVRFGARERV